MVIFEYSHVVPLPFSQIMIARSAIGLGFITKYFRVLSYFMWLCSVRVFSLTLLWVVYICNLSNYARRLLWLPLMINQALKGGISTTKDVQQCRKTNFYVLWILNVKQCLRNVDPYFHIFKEVVQFYVFILCFIFFLNSATTCY